MSVFEIELVICTYNNMELLRGTLDAIAQQRTSPDVAWSVTVVDNNCTDDTADVVDQFIASGRIPNLRRVVEPKQGIVWARHRGLRDSRAPYVAFIDDDNILSADWVEHAVAFVRAHPQVGAFGGRVEVVFLEDDPPALARQYKHIFAEQDLGEQARRLDHDVTPYIVGAGMVVRCECLLNSVWMTRSALVGRLGKVLCSGEDYEMIHYIRSEGREVWYEPAIRLRHLIPSRRTTFDYMIRLRREGSVSHALLECWRLGRTPNRRLALRQIVRLYSRLVQYHVKIAVNAILGDRMRCDRYRLSKAKYLGQLKGWWHVVRHGSQYADRLVSAAATAEAVSHPTPPTSEKEARYETDPQHDCS